MWVELTDGNYVNLAQADKIDLYDVGDGTFMLVAHVGNVNGLLKTASTFTSVAQAQAAIQQIVSGTTLTV